MIWPCGIAGFVRTFPRTVARLPSPRHSARKPSSTRRSDQPSGQVTAPSARRRTRRSRVRHRPCRRLSQSSPLIDPYVQSAERASCDRPSAGTASRIEWEAGSPTVDPAAHRFTQPPTSPATSVAKLALMRPQQLAAASATPYRSSFSPTPTTIVVRLVPFGPQKLLVSWAKESAKPSRRDGSIG
jgi:hypothetical protein